MVELFLTIPECNPNCTDNDGCTPLTLANDTKIIKCLHSSHDTIIRNASSGGIFLFVIDLTATESDLQSTVFFWLSSLQKQVSSNSDESCKPHLLLIGSHADSLASKSDLMKSACSSVSKLHVAGFLAVDCRYSESPSLTQLRRKIFEIQQSK